MTTLSARGITIVSEEKAALVDDAHLSLKPGELVSLIGPNGAGKTSLLRAAIGLVTPRNGVSTIGDENVQNLSSDARARLIAYLPQVRPLAWPTRVRDIVALGRFAYGITLSKPSDEDQAAIKKAMEEADITHLKDRRADTLSGGELARVHIARALAAKAPLLIADEPVAALDPRHQLRVLDVIKRYVAQGGGALVVLHDLQLAARYSTRLVWMKAGKVIASGAPSSSLTPERMADVFGVEATFDGHTVDVRAAL